MESGRSATESSSDHHRRNLTGGSGEFAYHSAVSSYRVAALLFALTLFAPGLGAQGIPGTPVYRAARAGWDALRDGRNQEAAEAFAHAIDLEPSDPSLHFGAGVAAFMLGQTTTARHALERALGMAPTLTQASLLLGDIQYRGSDIDGAIRTYESALQYAPADATLIARLDRLRREAEVHGAFFASHGTHFTVLFEGPADEAIANRAIEILEAA